MKKQTPVDNILSEVAVLIKWFEDYEEWYNRQTATATNEDEGDDPPPPPPGGDTPPPPPKP